MFNVLCHNYCNYRVRPSRSRGTHPSLLLDEFNIMYIFRCTIDFYQGMLCYIYIGRLTGFSLGITRKLSFKYNVIGIRIIAKVLVA